MGFPEETNMKASRGLNFPFGAFPLCFPSIMKAGGKNGAGGAQ